MSTVAQIDAAIGGATNAVYEQMQTLLAWAGFAVGFGFSWPSFKALRTLSASAIA